MEETILNLNSVDPSIFENMDSFFFLIETNGDIIYTNSIVSKELGYEIEELSKLKITDLFPPKRKDEINNIIEDALKHDEMQVFSSNILKKNHRSVLVENCVSVGSKNSDNRKKLIIISRKLQETEKVAISYKEEEDIFQEKNMVRYIIEENPFAIAIFNSKGKYIHSNRNFKWFLQPYEPDEKYSLFNDKIIKNVGFQKELNEAIFKGKVYRSKEFLLNLHELNPKLPQKIFWIKITCFSIFDSNGNLLHPILIYENVTKRKLAEKNISFYKKNLENIIDERTLKLKESTYKLQNKLKIEKLLSKISSQFVGIYNINNSVKLTLKDLGRYFNASRGYLLSIEKNHAFSSIEWCNTNVTSKFEGEIYLKFEDIPWWDKKLLNGEMKKIPDVNNLSNLSSEDKKLFTRFNIKSLLIFPIIIKEELYGIIGFDNIDLTNWDETNLHGIQVVSEIISNALERQIIEQELKQEHNRLTKIIQLNPYAISIFDSSGHFRTGNNAFKAISKVKIPEKLSLFNFSLFKDIEISNKVKKLKEGATVYVPEFSYSTKNLDYILKCRIFPIYSASEIISNYILMLEDITRQKKAESRLKESEKKYRVIFENNAIGVGIIDDSGSGKVIEINDAMAKMLGMDIDELNRVGLKYTYVDSSSRSKILKKLKDSGKLDNYEVHLKNANGKKYWALISTRTFTFEGKSAYITTQLDISKRKKAQKALLESEKKYRNLVELSDDVIFKIDLYGKFIFINKAVKKKWGYDEIDVINHYILEFIHPDDYNYAGNILKNVYNNNKILNAEYRVLKKNGESLILSTNAIPIYNPEGNKIIAIYGISRDITKKVQTQRELKSSEEKYRMLVETSQDMIFIVNKLGDFTFVNQAFKNILGYNKNELLDINSLSLVHKNNLKYVESTLIEVSKGQNVSNIEYKFRKKNGDFVLISTSGSPLYDSDGNLNGLIGVSRDITILKKVEAELHRRKLQVQYSNVIAMISSMLVHDPTKTRKKITEVLATLGNVIEVDFIILFKHNSNNNARTNEPNLITGFWKLKNYIFSKYDLKNLFSEKFFNEYSKKLPLNIVSNLKTSSFNLSIEEKFIEKNVGSLLLVPVFIGKKKYGTLILSSNNPSKIYSQKEKSLCLNVALLLGLGLKTESEHEIKSNLFDAMKELEVPLFVAQKNKDGLEKFVYVNKYFCNITGFTEEEVYNMDNILDFIPPKEQKYITEFTLSRENGKEIPVSYRINWITKTGIMPLNLHLSWSTIEQKRSTIGILIDPKESADLISADEIFEKYIKKT